MVTGGNLFTGYGYEFCRVQQKRTAERLQLNISTSCSNADLAVVARLDRPAQQPPSGSPFPDLETARRFAGPLPFTFSYEASTGRMVVVEGVRQNWKPTPVEVEISRSSFLEREPFSQAEPKLANAFFIENVPYSWRPGYLA